MTKIPTALEILVTYYSKDSNNNSIIYPGKAEEAMIEFARIQVKAALEAASKEKPYYSEPEWPHKKVSVTYDVKKLKDDILSAYPEDKII